MAERRIGKSNLIKQALKENNTKYCIYEEIKQVEKTGLNCYKYAFISRSGFKCKQKDNLILIKLEDLFK